MQLVVRADAGVEIGTGHVLRCLAIAQAWQAAGGSVTFILATSTLADRLNTEGIEVKYLLAEPGTTEDAIQTLRITQEQQAEWLVVDGYSFGSEYQKLIKQAGVRLLVLDDCGHGNDYVADLVLNQNISADQDLYRQRAPYTKLLLGSTYTLLRREFWPWRNWQRVINSTAYKLLVTLGGSDPDNVTLKVVQALEWLGTDDLEVLVVIGGANPYFQVLEKQISASNLAISAHRNVRQMPELMAWADLAIAGGGSTNWELAFMGLPSLVITIAENQRLIAAELARQQVIVHLGWHQELSLEQIARGVQALIGDRCQRAAMSQKGRNLVDGNGVQLVVSAMLSQKNIPSPIV